MARKKNSAGQAGTSGEKGRMINYAVVSALSKATKLADVKMVELQAKIDNFVPQWDARKMDQVVSFRGALVTGTPGDSVAAIVSFEYEMHFDDKRVVIVEGKYFVLYSCASGAELEGFDKESLTQYAETMGVLNAWPYMRETIGDVCRRLGFVGVLLPIWHLPTTLPPKGDAYKMESKGQK